MGRVDSRWHGAKVARRGEFEERKRGDEEGLLWELESQEQCFKRVVGFLGFFVCFLKRVILVALRNKRTRK